MSDFPSLTLILFAEDGKTDQQIWEQVRALGRAQWRCQVIVVHPQIPSLQDERLNSRERITYRPSPFIARSLPEAIEHAKHNHLLVVEPGTHVTTDQWRNVLNNLNDQSAIARFEVVRPTKSRHRIWFWHYTMLFQCLLRTGKHVFTSGFTYFNKTTVAEFATEVDETSSPSFQVGQLLALLRLNRRGVVEERITTPARTETRTGFKDSLSHSLDTIHFWWNTIMFPRGNDFADADARISPPRRIQFALSLILLAVTCLLFFSNLNYPFFEPDEARNAQLAANVVESGDWLSLKLADKWYWDKPPLQIWMIATSYSIFGQSQLTTRVPVALASVLTVVLTLILGKRLVGFTAALAGATLLLLSTGFVLVGRYVTMDASLTLAATALFLFGWLSLEKPHRKIYAVSAGIAMGLGVLFKGPVILVLCGIPLMAQLWLSNSVSTKRNRQSTSGSYPWKALLIPAALIALPWYLATAIVHPDFVGYFFWKHHVVRFSDAFNHREPFWYYIVGIFVFMFPASYLLPSVAKFAFSRKSTNRMLRTKSMGFLVLAASWILIFFSLSTSKLPTYIVPAFPMICLLMGSMLDRKVLNLSEAQNEKTIGTHPAYLYRFKPRATLELAFWCIATSGGTLIFLDAGEYVNPSMIWIGILVTLGIMLSSAIATQRSKSPLVAWPAFGVLALCFVVIGSHFLAPTISVNRSIHANAKKLKSTEQLSDAPIVFYGREAYGAGFTMNEQNVVAFEEDELGSLIHFLQAKPHAIIISSKDPMALLRSTLPYSITINECEGMRHLYVSQPNQGVIARQTEQELLR